MAVAKIKNTSPAPLPHGGTKEVGGGRFKSGVLLIFCDIHTRFINGFDDDRTFGLGDIPSSCVKDMVLMLTCASNPNDTILAFNGRSLVVIIQVYQLTGTKEQLNSWGL